MANETSKTYTPDAHLDEHTLAQRRFVCEAITDLIEREHQRVVLFILWLGDQRSREIISAFHQEFPDEKPIPENKDPWRTLFVQLRVAVRLAPDLAGVLNQPVDTNEVLTVVIGERGLQVDVRALSGPSLLALLRTVYWLANEEPTAG